MTQGLNPQRLGPNALQGPNPQQLGPNAGGPNAGRLNAGGQLELAVVNTQQNELINTTI
jgi:hypothetical protein